jgi:hypothetical protein
MPVGIKKLFFYPIGPLPLPLMMGIGIEVRVP